MKISYFLFCFCCLFNNALVAHTIQFGIIRRRRNTGKYLERIWNEAVVA
jgi:hypothetical protein